MIKYVNTLNTTTIMSLIIMSIMCLVIYFHHKAQSVMNCGLSRIPIISNPALSLKKTGGTIMAACWQLVEYYRHLQVKWNIGHVSTIIVGQGTHKASSITRINKSKQSQN